MRFAIPLFVRELHGGQVLVVVAAEPSLAVYADTLEAARLDLTLLLEDRIARMHPRELHRYASPDNLRVERWSLEGALPVHVAAACAKRPLEVTAVASRHKEHERLWFPAWDLRVWASESPEEEGLALLRRHLPTLANAALLERRVQREERLELLELDVEPPPLAAFTGPLRGASWLPSTLTKTESGDAKTRPAPPTPNLDAIGTELTMRAREGLIPRACGLDVLVDRLARELDTPGAAIVLVGASGVGKTAAIHELAHRLAKGPRPMWSADATRLIAARSMWTDWRSQTLSVMDEVRALSAVWAIGPLLALLDAGKSIASKENVAQLLRPELARRRLSVLAECTTDDWARLELRDPGFARLFTVIRVEEPDEAGSLAILRGLAGTRRARGAPLVVAESGARAARELAARFGGHASTHAAAVTLLLRALSDARAERREAPLDRTALVNTFCRETGMPAALIQDDVPLHLDDVRAALERRIVGQPEAIERLVSLVGMIKSGLSDPGRPLGSLLFVGPTGVGKTECAKALTALLYGADDRLVRFDMGEMSSPDAVSRFLGFGGRPGKLVSEIRRLPFSVLLLDEIEKAHPSAFDALLAVLGEARLTDEAGRTASFRNVVVVMTSNLGVETLRGAVGFGDEGTRSWRDHFVAEARRFFRPELFNRIDHVVAFAPLVGHAIRGIADRELARLAAREGLRQRGVSLEVGEEARGWLAARGIDPRLGARPLKRTLERHVTQNLAEHLAGTRVEGGRARIVIEDDAVRCRYEPAPSRDGGALELRRAVTRIGELRYFLEAAWQGAALHDLRLEMGRMERLLESPRYLAGHADLGRRLAAQGNDTQLQADALALKEQVASLEELAYEASFAQDGSTLPELAREREAALHALGELGLRLAARGSESPHSALVVGLGRPSAQGLWQRILRAWGEIATRRGWRARGFGLEERIRPTDDVTVSTFVRTAIVVGPEETAPRRVAEGVLALFRETDAIFAVSFEGPHAGVLFASERGAHVQHEPGGGTQRANVRVDQGLDLLSRELDAEALTALRGTLPQEVRRVLHDGRRTMADRPLGISMASEPRLERLYERAMIADVWERVFFPGAHRSFAGEGNPR